MARADNARAVASMVKAKARVTAETVMAVGVAKVAKMVEEWVEASGWTGVRWRWRRDWV